MRYLSSVYDPPSEPVRFYERKEPNITTNTLEKTLIREAMNALPYDRMVRESFVNPVMDYFNEGLAQITPDFKSIEDRRMLFEMYRPWAYPDVFSATRGLIYYKLGKSAPPELDQQGDYTIQEEAWAKALGLPTKNKYIVPQTKYRPLNEKKPNSKYYKLGGDIVDYDLLRKEIKKRGMKPGSKVEIPSLAPFIKKEVLEDYFANKPKDFGDDKITPEEYFSQFDPIAGFQLGVNKKGQPYIYDIYDFDFAPLKKVTKPYEYEFYDEFPMNPFNVYNSRNKR
ncbi:MAG: hypothetical protein FJZ63_01580 [Chlamydiae bacterium]|nr:hypothetical protein [Chlamydiota bacterium]